MTPKRVKIYRDPAYPDRLSLAQAALRDHQPRAWLRPAMAAAVLAALGAGLSGCPKKTPDTIEPQRPPTEQPGSTVAPGTTVAPGGTVAPGDTMPMPLPGVPVPPTTYTEELPPPVPHK